MKSARARNLTIRINQQGEVRVTVPRTISRRKAEAFVRSKKSWIGRKLEEINRYNGSSRMPGVGEFLTIRGWSVPIVLKGKEQSAEEAIWRILKKEAREYLPARVDELAERFGFQYTGLKIRKMKTRWGSCTSRKSINLNSWLVMLPDHLSDYVILHELVHTRHPDHSKQFWNALDEVTGGKALALRKELRQRRILGF